MKWILSLILVACLGCECAEKAVLRESMYQGVRTQRQLSKEWAAKLVTDPVTGQDKRAEITPLTPTQYRNLLAADEEFENLVVKDRQNDRIKIQR